MEKGGDHPVMFVRSLKKALEFVSFEDIQNLLRTTPAARQADFDANVV